MAPAARTAGGELDAKPQPNIDKGSIWALSDADSRELLEPLGLPMAPGTIELLSASVKQAGVYLVSFIRTETEEMRQGREELELIANDPARALENPPATMAADDYRGALLDYARAVGIDPETRKGAAAIGDIARQWADRKQPRKRHYFGMGEKAVFLTLVTALDGLSPDHLNSLPSNADRTARNSTVDFAEEFVLKVADRARLAFDPKDTEANAQLDRLKGKDGALIDAVRDARKMYRSHKDRASKST